MFMSKQTCAIRTTVLVQTIAKLCPEVNTRGYAMLTPMRVEKSRMIPVIHAKLFRTSTTEAVALVWLASSSRLEMCNEDGASIMDPKNDEASSADITSPTIFPV